MRGTQHGKTLVVLQVVDAIRDHFPFRITGEIFFQHRQRYLPPGATGILKVTDQLFLLRIHANGRLTSLEKRSSLTQDIAYLPIPLRVLFLGQALAIDAQRIAAPPEQSAYGRYSDLESA